MSCSSAQSQEAVGPIKVIIWSRETFIMFKVCRYQSGNISFSSCSWLLISWDCLKMPFVLNVTTLKSCERGHQEVIEKADIGGSTFREKPPTYGRS